MRITALEAAEIAQIDAQETRAEKFWYWIPFLGWAYANLLWHKRTSPIVEHIETQLARRPRPEPLSWGSNPRRVQIGLCLSRVAKEEMGWPNDHFIPADPVNVVFWAHNDGLDFESAVMLIEAELDVEMSEAEITGWFDKTLADVVDELLTKETQKTG